MIDYPMTLADARRYRYQKWSGNEQGNRYREGECAFEVWPTTGWLPYQCSRKNGHGPASLYCKQHSKIVAQFVKKESR